MWCAVCVDVEVAFFARWFDQQSPRVVNMTKKLVANKQLEFVRLLF
jgi:hypothetical protein